MISKNQIKKIASLGLKKQRDLHGLFVVEGTKSVLDVCNFLSPLNVYANQGWIEMHPQLPFSVEVVSDGDLKRMSHLKTAQGVVAVFSKILHKDPDSGITKGLVLALDDVRDPGNLGTIIRLADWFGVSRVLCSKGCADVYNPKVVQATMGSIARVRVDYVDLEKVILQSDLPVYGTFMDGDTIYECKLPQSAIVVMGNEGKGISNEIQDLVKHKISIPSFSHNAQGAESLNVSIATAIVCSEFKRNHSFPIK